MATQSIQLNPIFPAGFQVKVREDVPKFTIWIGDPQPVEVVDGFIFADYGQVDDNGNIVQLASEYVEENYAGIDEEFSLFIDNNSTEGSVEDVYEFLPTSTSGALTFDGKKFLLPDPSKRYPTTYTFYIDYNKMPKPKLTKRGLIQVKLKVEGGLTGDPNDSAAKKGYCPTLKNGKKYHTNKGVTYAVWKNIFGTGNDQRFLNMNHDDWTEVFDTLYWNKNAKSKYESVNCLLVSFAWGGNKQKTVENALKLLGSQSLDSVSEEKAVAALISARAQFFINISQPDVPNNKFRRGWINAINSFISETYGF